MKIQPSKSKVRTDNLEAKARKVKKKDLAVLLAPYIQREDGLATGPHATRWWCIWGTNFAGQSVEVRCKTRAECLDDLATLHGITVAA